MTEGYAVSELQAPAGSVFVLTAVHGLKPEAVERIRDVWARAWTDAGREMAPPLLILDGGTTLEAIGAGEMRDAGELRAGDGVAGAAGGEDRTPPAVAVSQGARSP